MRTLFLRWHDGTGGVRFSLIVAIKRTGCFMPGLTERRRHRFRLFQSSICLS